MKFRITFTILLSIWFAAPAWLLAQTDQPDFAAIREEHELIKKHAHQRDGNMPNAFNQSGIVHQSFDVQHYRLKISLDPNASTFSGTVTITGAATSLLSALNIDAQTNIIIDAVRLNGQSRNYERKTEQLSLTFLPALLAGDEISVEIDYHGTPVVMSRLGGGMFAAKHGSDNRAVMATLTEP